MNKVEDVSSCLCEDLEGDITQYCYSGPESLVKGMDPQFAWSTHHQTPPSPHSEPSGTWLWLAVAMVYLLLFMAWDRLP